MALYVPAELGICRTPIRGEVVRDQEGLNRYWGGQVSRG